MPTVRGLWISPTVGRIGAQATYGMLVLSIDIDFFVDPVAHDEALGAEERLPQNEYATDPPAIVESFLARCGLVSTDPVPAVFIRHHDAAFDILREVANSTPVRLVHVDAHSDTSFGDPGYSYLLTDLAHEAPERRRQPRRAWNGLNAGNWLPFAVANGWISSIAFVPRSFPPSDINRWFFPTGPQQLVVTRASAAAQPASPRWRGPWVPPPRPPASRSGGLLLALGGHGKRRVVRVAVECLSVDGCLIDSSEWRAGRETRDEVRIGNERSAERHEVDDPFLDQPVRSSLVDVDVGDHVSAIHLAKVPEHFVAAQVGDGRGRKVGRAGAPHQAGRRIRPSPRSG
jgi:hypothetical protein